MKKQIVIGGTCFLAGVVGLQFYARRLEERALGGRPIEALVVRADLEAGTVLHKAHVGSISIPADYLESRRLTRERLGDVLGQTLAVDLHAGDGLIESDFQGGPAPARLANQVMPGRRAYSLRASSNPFDRLLEAGDRVDVLLLESAEARTLLEDIVVLSVGGRLDGDAEETTRSYDADVSLSVTREQSRTLLAAEDKGTLRLVLRNPSDEQEPAGSTNQPQKRDAPAAARAVVNREIEHVR